LTQPPRWQEVRGWKPRSLAAKMAAATVAASCRQSGCKRYEERVEFRILLK